MRGLKLFVRPAEPSDAPAIRALISSGNGLPSHAESTFLIGKLLGDLVAVVGFDYAGEVLRVDCIIVVAALRKKRIGRVMMNELEQLAVKLEKQKIVVENAGPAAEFFSRVGFTSEGERWIKSVALRSP